jgi:hypothetical protein
MCVVYEHDLYLTHEYLYLSSTSWRIMEVRLNVSTYNWQIIRRWQLISVVRSAWEFRHLPVSISSSQWFLTGKAKDEEVLVYVYKTTEQKKSLPFQANHLSVPVTRLCTYIYIRVYVTFTLDLATSSRTAPFAGNKSRGWRKNKSELISRVCLGQKGPSLRRYTLAYRCDASIV